MSDELGELTEHAEHGHGSLAPVTLTMAILAVLVASVTLLGHRAHTEEVLKQSEAADQWAYYQAKDSRLHAYEMKLEDYGIFALQPGINPAEQKEKYEKEVERYTEQMKDIQAEAKKAANEVRIEERRADKYDLAEVLLEAALVVCSITLLTKKRIFWYFGIVLSVIGIVFGAGGWMVH
jgi:Domain of unknown function (DUF4337)